MDRNHRHRRPFLPCAGVPHATRNLVNAMTVKTFESKSSQEAMNIGHRMIAERQREIAVSLKALHMMQEHHGNRYFSFLCVRPEEERDWYAKAEKLIPQVSES